MINPISVHLSVGQSNGWGSGDVSLMPKNVTLGTCLTYWNNTFPDPTPGNFQLLQSEAFSISSNTGSMWLSYQIERHSICHIPSCMIPSSIGGSAMSGENGGHHWGRNGKWFDISIRLLTDAMSQLALYGYTAMFKSIEWCQGEAEAGYIATGQMRKEQVVSVLLDVADHYHELYPKVPFNIYRTGSVSVGEGDKGFAEVRWAQERAAIIDPYINIVYRGASGFPDRGLINVSDNIHWNQIGLNEAGTMGARNELKPSI